MAHKILLLAGDGIGPEIVGAAELLLGALVERFGLSCEIEHALMGGCAIEAHGDSLPDATLKLAHAADAILLGAVGGPQWDKAERSIRPERGLLRLRSELDLFCNLRPAVLIDSLAEASTLKPEVVAGLDLMIIRELTGGIYFGEPRGIDTGADGRRRGYNTLVYTEDEIERIARLGFEVARRRSSRLCSVDKANVLEVTELWRDIVLGLADDYPDVELSHMYVDNAAMQLVRAPTQFDVIVTTNLFGDILSDLAAMLTGSIGMLPSASLNAEDKGLFEPVHGSAPDIAGKGLANPLATILSVAMMFRYTLGEEALADKVEAAVTAVLAEGVRTADIARDGGPSVSTGQMAQAVIEALGTSE
ncbi:MAG: 3-isopropylmalate dehydrogenase [Gammaproteobacteria bacterium]|nr:3-isopropylmalate dehydrogenase [Gammaproteobacteria bacterium]